MCALREPLGDIGRIGMYALFLSLFRIHLILLLLLFLIYCYYLELIIVPHEVKRKEKIAAPPAMWK